MNNKARKGSTVDANLQNRKESNASQPSSINNSSVISEIPFIPQIQKNKKFKYPIKSINE